MICTPVKLSMCVGLVVVPSEVFHSHSHSYSHSLQTFLTLILTPRWFKSQLPRLRVGNQAAVVTLFGVSLT